MFQVDQKFHHFSLEVYLPGKDKVGKVTPDTFFGKRSKTKFLVIFFYPADFTFVCPTELADMNRRYPEFKKYGAEILSVSTDTVYTHKAWVEAELTLKGINYSMAADHNGKFSRLLGIYDEEKGMAQRAAFIVDRNMILRAVDITADEIGRSAGELLRKVKALYFVSAHAGRVCPASWDEGAATLAPSIKIVGKVHENLMKKR